MAKQKQRPGDTSIPGDPAALADDARLIFIGRIRTPWKTLAECPKNLTGARANGANSIVELDEPWRAGLTGLERYSHIILLYWMHEARRDLIMQQPRHRSEPAGMFALRTPARANPIAMANVRVDSLDQSTGRIAIDAIDCLDGTALLDIKPWYAGLDTPE